MCKIERNISVDVLRTFGIVMVMLGHYYYFPIPYYNSFLQSIHLPIFFIINGYFLHHEWNVSTLKKETASYLLPYFVTSAIILLLGIAKNDSLTTNLLAILWGKSTMHVPYPDAIFAKFPRIGAIWFLWALWWSRQFVHFSIKFNHILLFPIAFFFIGVFSFEKIYLPFSIQSGLVASAYTAIGKIIRDSKFLEKKCSSIPLIVICILLWGGCILYGGVNIGICHFKNIPICFVGSICGVYLTYLLSKKIATISSLRKIWKIGETSLFILCLHLIDLYVLNINSYCNLFPDNPFFFNYFIGMLFVTFYMFVIYFLFKRIPFFKFTFKIK